MGARRLFGSGGFFGYWGIFKEGDVGRYAAYFGKASDCFLVRMKNGDKYVVPAETGKRKLKTAPLGGFSKQDVDLYIGELANKISELRGKL